MEFCEHKPKNGWLNRQRRHGLIEKLKSVATAILVAAVYFGISGICGYIELTH